MDVMFCTDTVCTWEMNVNPLSIETFNNKTLEALVIDSGQMESFFDTIEQIYDPFMPFNGLQSGFVLSSDLERFRR